MCKIRLQWPKVLSCLHYGFDENKFLAPSAQHVLFFSIRARTYILQRIYRPRFSDLRRCPYRSQNVSPADRVTLTQTPHRPPAERYKTVTLHPESKISSASFLLSPPILHHSCVMLTTLKTKYELRSYGHLIILKNSQSYAQWKFVIKLKSFIIFKICRTVNFTCAQFCG